MKNCLKFFLIAITAVLLTASTSMALSITLDSMEGADDPDDGIFSYNEADLQKILNDITVDGNSDVVVTEHYLEDTLDDYWAISASGGSTATIIIELAGYAAGNIFGVYDAQNPNTLVPLFSGSASAGSQVWLSIKIDGSVHVVDPNTLAGGDTGIDFAANNFGFYLTTTNTNPDLTYYSDTALNFDGFDHMAAFEGTGQSVQLPGLVAGVWGSNEYVLAWEDLAGGDKNQDSDYNDFVVMVESVNPVPEPGSLAAFGFGIMGLLGFARSRWS